MLDVLNGGTFLLLFYLGISSFDSKGCTNLEMGKQTLSSDDFVGWAKSWAIKNKSTEKMLSLKIGRTRSLFTKLLKSVAFSPSTFMNIEYGT